MELFGTCERMSLKFGVGHIFCIIFISFVDSKLLPVDYTEIDDNSIDNNNSNNNEKGNGINLSMPGTKWCDQFFCCLYHWTFYSKSVSFWMQKKNI